MSKTNTDSGQHGESGGRRGKTFAAGVAAVFLLVGLVTVINHEPWRDELQAWLIAVESWSLAELFWNLRYDGHPPLWYLMLYALSRLTRDPLAMQLLHLSVATATAYVFARFAPFTRLQRALFCFGYFPAYEYAAVSRNYAPGVLCLFAFCAAYGAGAKKNYLLLSLLLALLANANVYGFFIAWALALMLVYEFWRARRAGADGAGASRVVPAALLFVAASVASALVILPPADGGNVVGWNLVPRPGAAASALSVVWRGFVPFPPLSYYIWNRNALRPGVPVALISCVILAATLLMLARRRAALVAYSAGTAAILLFTYTKFYGGVRHHGHLYVLFVACLWLAARTPDADGLPRRWPLVERAERLVSAHGQRLLSALLITHMLIAAAFVVADWLHPFSRARDAARFLRSRGLNDHYVVADMDAHASGMTAYLGRRFFYARGAREGTYILWDRTWGEWPLAPGQRADLLGAARRKAFERGREVLVVSNYRLSAADLEPVGEMTGSMVGDEDYYLYVVRHSPPAAATRAEPAP